MIPRSLRLISSHLSVNYDQPQTLHNCAWPVCTLWLYLTLLSPIPKFIQVLTTQIILWNIRVSFDIPREFFLQNTEDFITFKNQGYRIMVCKKASHPAPRLITVRSIPR